LNSISERDLPEVTDDFAAGLDMGVKSVLDLRVDLGKRLEAEAAKRVQGDTEVAVLDQLVERNQFAVPQPLIDEEIRALLVRLGFVDPKKMRVDRINVEPFRKQFGDVALKRVRSAILIDRLSEIENLVATEDEIRTSVEERAAEHGISAEDLLKAVREGNRLEQWGLELTREKVMKSLIGRATISYVEKKAEEKAEA
jgi:trigger factor